MLMPDHPIHNRNPVAVAFLGHARARHEAQGGGIHAVAQAAAVGRAVGEHVAQVNLCVRRAHFDAVAARNAVVLMLGQQVTGNRAGERGPAAAGIELVSRREQRLAADDVHVNAGLKLLVILVDERALGSGVLCDRELLKRQIPDAFHVLLTAFYVRDCGDRHMAVAAGIVHQIVLMMCLGRVEVAQRLDQDRHIHGALRLVRVEHASAVLPAAVFALLVHGERVNDLQKQ